MEHHEDRGLQAVTTDVAAQRFWQRKAISTPVLKAWTEADLVTF